MAFFAAIFWARPNARSVRRSAMFRTATPYRLPVSRVAAAPAARSRFTAE
jgi:hypothetical protein